MFVGDSATSHLAVSRNLVVGARAQFSVELCWGCATLSTVTIGGNVLADHADVLDLPNVTVNGNVVATGLSSEITMVFATVAGNVIVTGRPALSFRLALTRFAASCWSSTTILRSAPASASSSLRETTYVGI